MKKLIKMFTALLVGSATMLCISCETVDPPVSITWANEYGFVAAGGNHSMVLEPNGTLWTWGSNLWGQLGDSTVEDRNRPSQVGTGYASASAGQEYSLALKPDGSLWAWGDNYFGQIGDGSNIAKSLPTRIGPD